MERLTLEQSLLLINKNITTLRLGPKGKDEYDTLYVMFKSFFKLINIDFPQGPYKLTLRIPEIKIILEKIIDEFTILAFYLGYKEIGLQLSDKLILDENCKLNKSQVIHNQKFYVNKLLTLKNEKIQSDISSGYFPLNPSIIKTNEGYLMSLRTVNYALTPEGFYTVPSGESFKQSKNYILKLDNNLNIISSNDIIDTDNYVKYEGANFKGLEDLILFRYNDELWFSCTTLDTNPYKVPQITLCKLQKTDDGYRVTLKRPIVLPNNKIEKNWLPVIHDDQIKFIYEYHPFTIKIPMIVSDSLNGTIGSMDYLKVKYDLNLSRFKGSAAPIEFNLDEKGYLIMVHETFNLSQVLRCYLHRFIWLSNSFEIKKMSHPWYFQHHGIEFCRSMCYSHIEDEIILTYSIHDKDAQWCSVSIEYIKSLLFDLDYFKF